MYETLGQSSTLQGLCQGRPEDAERNLRNLKRLQEFDFIRKEDIDTQKLLEHALKMYDRYDYNWDYAMNQNGDVTDLHYEYDESYEYDEKFVSFHEKSHEPNEDIFLYLVEWDPDALKKPSFGRTILANFIDQHFEEEEVSCGFNYTIDNIQNLLDIAIEHFEIMSSLFYVLSG